jgi:hypothetical protein
MANFKKHPKGFFHKTISDSQMEIGYDDLTFKLSYIKEGNVLQVENIDTNRTHTNENTLARVLKGLLHFEVMLAPESIIVILKNSDNLLEKMIIAHHLALGYASTEGVTNQFNTTILFKYAK